MGDDRVEEPPLGDVGLEVDVLPARLDAGRLGGDPGDARLGVVGGDAVGADVGDDYYGDTSYGLYS